jgi:hypothetical protein
VAALLHGRIRGFAILPDVPVPPLRGISATILVFGELLPSQFDADQSLDVARPTLEIIILAWNAHVMACLAGDRQP